MPWGYEGTPGDKHPAKAVNKAVLTKVRAAFFVGVDSSCYDLQHVGSLGQVPPARRLKANWYRFFCESFRCFKCGFSNSTVLE